MNGTNSLPLPNTHALQRVARNAGVLFIIATVSTIVAQIILTPSLDASQVATVPHTNLDALAVLLELANALASVGIAIVLTGSLVLPVIEGAVGVVAAAVLAMVLSTSAGEVAFTLEMHDSAFLITLPIFSCGALLLFPMLFVFPTGPARVVALGPGRRNDATGILRSDPVWPDRGWQDNRPSPFLTNLDQRNGAGAMAGRQGLRPVTCWDR